MKRYRPKEGEKFTVRGRNVLGEIVNSNSIYTCRQIDYQFCVATHNGLKFNFKHDRDFEYVPINKALE